MENGQSSRAAKDALIEEIMSQLTRSPENYLKIAGKRTEAEQRTALSPMVDAILNDIVPPEGFYLTRVIRQEIIDKIYDEIFGFGPIQPLILDPEVTEIMVNGPSRVFVERSGRIEKANVHFRDTTHLKNQIDRVVWRTGRRIDESSPMVDARLPDGSRVNAAIAPIALAGPYLTIRKFLQGFHTIDALVKRGTIDAEMASFIWDLVRARFNIVVSGGTGAGKTTFLNMLAGLTSPQERLITIEDSAELRFDAEHENVCAFEARPKNIEGRGEIAIRDLIRNALRMRPDRLVVGEVRGAEAFDMLQAMNTGHEGSFTTLHANSAEDLFSRLEAMTCMAVSELPMEAIRSIIVSAVQIIVQVKRFADGSRRVSEIAEVSGLKHDGSIALSPIWTLEALSPYDTGNVRFQYRRYPLPPRTRQKFEEAGILAVDQPEISENQSGDPKILPGILERMRAKH